MKRYWALGLMSILVASCGAPVKNPAAPPPQIFQTNLSASPLLLSKQVRECPSPNKAMLDEFMLNLFKAGQFRTESLPFRQLLEGKFLRNPGVLARTEYDESIEYVLSNNTLKVLLHSKPKEVDLCPDTEYVSYSIESAALNASYFINKAQANFTAATGTSLPPVTLKISPEIKQTIIEGNQAQSMWLTDNAFYRPDAKTITFLPHSNEAKLAGLVNLWEVPLVPAHEYGHHVFNTLFGQIGRSTNVISTCFDSYQLKSQLMGPSRDKIRNVQVPDVLQALNEGFADLIAFYTLDEEENRLDFVLCMQISRDVNHSTFSEGTPKTFSSLALKSFFSRVDDSEGKRCDDVNYQDIHTLGAIFAYNADRFLSLLTDSKALKLQLLRDWVLKIKAEHYRLSSLPPERYLEGAVLEFFKLALRRFNAEFNQATCAEVSRIYPGLVGAIPECR